MEGGAKKRRSTQPVEKSIPGTYKVGGRRMTKPTGLARDSSLGINKAPGKCLSCREAQTANGKYRRSRTFPPSKIPGLFRQRPVFPWQATLLPAILIVTIMVKRQG
jgi:hypothetical protein